MSQKVTQQLLNLVPLKINTETQERLLHGYALLRSAHFTLQQMSLPFFEYVARGKKPESPAVMAEKYKHLLPALNAILKQDAAAIARGDYPWEVLKPEPWLQHSLRFPKILKDGVQIANRRDDRKAHDFSPEAKVLAAELPEYYTRNFHYQTDGYLSEDSAELYEHQVEILFAGAANAMRRSLIPMLKERLRQTGQDLQGEGLRFLEVGAGTGSLTRAMKLAFPKAAIVALDLSQPYLSQAQKRLKKMDIEFVQGAGESLSFGDESFDVVYSCFLFHELPLEVRKQVLCEGRRVLKPGGIYGLVDSIQAHEGEAFQWAIEQFPQDFHEPFYKNYTLHPMEDLIAAVGFNEISVKPCFLSKAVVASK